MRVTIDLTATIAGHAGLGRYAEQLTGSLLSDCPPDEQLSAFYNGPVRHRPPTPLDTLPATAIPLASKVWRLIVLLAQVSRLPQDGSLGSPDVFLATQHLLPRLAHAAGIFTLHDLIFRRLPEAHLPLNRWFLNLAVPRFLQAADAVIAVSQCSKRDAMNFYGVPSGKIYVIYEAADPRFRPVQDCAALDALRQRYGLPERFLLYVGTIEPRKNLPMLFEALRVAAVPGLKLVVAGKKGWLYDETFARLQALGLEADVLFTGFVPDADLPGLYTLAEAFVLPSIYEGFGLPLLEAMGCGAPVLSSNASSLPEVAGDAAILLPPGDVRAWAEAIQRIDDNAALRRDLSARGLRQSARFSWEMAAREVRQLYREVYARRR